MVVNMAIVKDYDYASSYPGKDAPWTFQEVPSEIREMIEKKLLKKGQKVLEIGCGEGFHSIFLAENGLDVTAIDISKKAIGIAKENAGKKNVKVNFIEKSYLELEDIKDRFDFIFDWRFLMVPTEEKVRDKYLKDVFFLLNLEGYYLSVAFSGDSNFMGNGKLRISPIGAKIYFENLDDSIERFKKYFKIVEAKHIIVPQKPNMEIKSNYILARKE